jgi:hypothetical protein
LASFGPALFHDEQFAFRDVAYFYYPLHQRIQAEWHAGRWPLWEPEENGGMPLLGNPSAAVLYPGKLIYAALPYPWAARLYVVAHTVLAFGTMVLMLRAWGTSATGSALAGLSYAFSVPILFQYSNLVYLVGAAWLPLGVCAVDGWLRLGRRGALLALALVLALQTLGGDPQTAYGLGVCAVGYALGVDWHRRRSQGNPRPWGPLRCLLIALGILGAWMILTLGVARAAPAWRGSSLVVRPLPWMPYIQAAVLGFWIVAGLIVLRCGLRGNRRAGLHSQLLGLAGAAALASMLAGAQVLPVLEFVSRSERGAEDQHDIYPFSLEPARIAGLVWPNFYGDRFTSNRSWFESLPPLGRHAKVWVPSLYLGGLTLVLALGAWGVRGGPPQRAWLSAVAVVSLLASLGEYSRPLWWARWVPALAREVGPHDPLFPEAIRADRCLRDGDGGIYWALATLLPGFGQFRYPSKLLTFTTLALTALGGLGWDRVSRGRCGTTSRAAFALLVLTCAGWVVLTVCRGPILEHWMPLATSGLGSWFGPLDARGAYHEAWRSMTQGAIVFGATALLARHARRAPVLAGLGALMVMTVDLAIANTRYIVTVPQALLDAEPRAVQLIRRAEQRDPSEGPFRVSRMRYWMPRIWMEVPAADRSRQLISWNRDTIEPKYAIPYGLQYTSAGSTAELGAYREFFSGSTVLVNDEVARRLRLRPGDLIYYLPRRAYDLWNTRYFVLPTFPNGWTDPYRAFASLQDQTERIEPAPDAFAGPGGEPRLRDWIRRQDYQIVRNRNAFSRAWVVHDARFHAPIATMGSAERARLLDEIRCAGDVYWQDPARVVFDPRVVAWVETEARAELSDFLPGGLPHPNESVRVREKTPQRVELDVALERPGLVILADVDYPGWHLTIDGTPAPIYRTNFLMRGAAVKEGRHRLIYEYQPWSFRVGLGITVVGLIVLVGLAARCGREVLVG